MGCGKDAQVIIQASYAITHSGKVVEDAVIEVSGKRINSVSSWRGPFSQRADLELDGFILAPGFTNPHCHLELEFCAGKTPYQGNFVDWLLRVRDLKAANGVTSYPVDSLRALAGSGCTTVVDHVTHDLDFDSISGFGMRYFPIREVFGFSLTDPAKVPDTAGGFGPHAPYSCSIELAKECRARTDAAGIPLSTHLSEFEGEISFITIGDNREIIEVLEELGDYPPGWQGTGMSPVAYYHQNGILDGNTYVIHCNYLTEGDIRILKQSKATVVYCPRSHDFFEHAQHPLPRLLDEGVNVALGTDSLASNSVLSVLEEANMAKKKFPDLGLHKLWEMVTTNPAVPLGLGMELGSIRPGAFADLAAFEVAVKPGASFEELVEAVLCTGKSGLTLCQGQVIHSEIPVPRQAIGKLAGSN